MAILKSDEVQEYIVNDKKEFKQNLKSLFSNRSEFFTKNIFKKKKLIIIF